MTNLEVIGIIALMIIIIGGGTILYLALAGTAIIYSLGANESPKAAGYFSASAKYTARASRITEAWFIHFQPRKQ